MSIGAAVPFMVSAAKYNIDREYVRKSVTRPQTEGEECRDQVEQRSVAEV